jgi:hypothetical protein
MSVLHSSSAHSDPLAADFYSFWYLIRMSTFIHSSRYIKSYTPSLSIPLTASHQSTRLYLPVGTLQLLAF